MNLGFIKDRRSRLLKIQASFQVAFLAYMVFVAGLTSMLNFMLLYYLQDSPGALSKILFIIFGLVILAAILGSGLILSNRLAGPLKRLHNHMTSVGEGEPTFSDLQFRKDDYCLELEEAYNKVLSRLRKAEGQPPVKRG